MHHRAALLALTAAAVVTAGALATSIYSGGNRSDGTLSVGGSGGAAFDGAANVWVDTNGGRCTRSASKVAWVDADACSSLSNACAAANAGDVIGIDHGTYAGQSVQCTKAVTFDGYADSVLGDLSVANQNEFCGKDYTVENIAAPAIAMGESSHGCVPPTTNINWINVDGGRIFWENAGHITWTGGDIGPGDTAGGNQNTIIGSGSTHDTIQRASIHGQPPGPGGHGESLRIDDSTSFITLDGDTWYSNSDETATILITDQSPGRTGDPRDITIENNVFGANSVGKIIQTQDPNVASCVNYFIGFNSYPPAPGFFAALLCPSKTNVVQEGNVDSSVVGRMTNPSGTPPDMH